MVAVCRAVQSLFNKLAYLGLGLSLLGSVALAAPSVAKHGVADLATQLAALTQEVDQLKQQLQMLSTQHQQTGLGLYGHAASVTTSPLLGRRSGYTPDDLLVEQPSMNEDLTLLEQRQAEAHALSGPAGVARPVVELSGSIQAKATYENSFARQSRYDIDLSTADIDALINVGPHVLGFMTLAYTQPEGMPLRPRVSASPIYLERAFLTVGDLERTPYYFSIGQMYLPFGRYKSALQTSPYPLIMGRILARAALLGYAHHGVYASVYGLHGDTYVHADAEINNWGVNVGYKSDKLPGDLGVSFVRNLADAAGFQHQGTHGFAKNDETERLAHAIPALDVHWASGSAPFGFVAEYLTALRRFDTVDLGYQEAGARPEALHLETTFRIEPKYPLNLALAYDRSWQALALEMPQKAWSAIVSTSLWKDTIESIQVQHAYDYPSGIRPAEGSDIVGTGHEKTLVWAHIGLYF